MRKLLYVPLIHGSADLGSLASSVDEKGVAVHGEERWEEHKRTISGFWDSIESYMDSLDVTDSQIYQDGLAADGSLGQRIVKEAARKGSRNYQVVERLMARGARIVKTEDISTVLKEVELIKKIAQSKSVPGRLFTGLKYELAKKRLLDERDEFIAKTIGDSLVRNGILFIGAFHNVIPKLASDIVVEEVKAKEKVEEYQRSFLSRGKQERVEELTRYLVAPVE
jgi:hypothetical protein